MMEKLYLDLTQSAQEKITKRTKETQYLSNYFKAFHGYFETP